MNLQKFARLQNLVSTVGLITKIMSFLLACYFSIKILSHAPILHCYANHVDMFPKMLDTYPQFDLKNAQ